MKTKFAATCFVMGALLAPVAAHAADTDADRTRPMTFVKDSIITTKVKAKLAAEKMSSLAHIKVDTTSKGEVVLDGNVKTQAEADRAVSITRGTEGVTSVTSNIRIQKIGVVENTDRRPMTFVKDSLITTKVKTKLAAEKMSSLAHIHVDTTSKGEVVLEGNVKTQADADKAVSITRETEGVNSVTSYLQVKKDI